MSDKMSESTLYSDGLHRFYLRISRRLAVSYPRVLPPKKNRDQATNNIIWTTFLALTSNSSKVTWKRHRILWNSPTQSNSQRKTPRNNNVWTIPFGTPPFKYMPLQTQAQASPRTKYSPLRQYYLNSTVNTSFSPPH